MAKKRPIEARIRILQNGHPIAETVQRLDRHRFLSISSGIKGELCLPLYPLAEEIDLFEIHKRAISIHLNDPWIGTIVANNEVHEINDLDRSERCYKLENNEYASITLGDLTVLVQVCNPFVESAVARNSLYSPSLLSLVANNASEQKTLALATFMAASIIFLAVFTLHSIPTERPKFFDQLADFYTMPFIHPDSLETSPEALKNTLDRRNYIGSVIKYYHSFANMYLGIAPPGSHFMIASVIERYKKSYHRYNSEIDKKIAQNTRDLAITKQTGEVLSMPIVHGESFQDRLIRMVDVLHQFHDGLKESLASRSSVAKAFRSDPEYDWSDYSSQDISTNYSPELAKIKLFSRQTNEESMYHEANKLAHRAQQIKNIQSRHMDHKPQLSTKNTRQIILNHHLGMIDLSNLHYNNIDSSKIQKIVSSQFGRKIKKKIQEPLIGQIDPSKIRAVIRRNRYQINLCYERALRRDHLIRGQTDWTWRIDSRGIVDELTLVDTTINDRDLTTCIRNSLAKWLFPKPKKGSIKITHSFTFEPQNG